MPDQGEVLYRVGSMRALMLETGNSDEPRICVEVEEITYGTMTGELSETYGQVEQRMGVRPFVVSQQTSFALALRMPSARWQKDRACHVDVSTGKQVLKCNRAPCAGRGMGTGHG